jgi:DNA-binding NtrC family response regulator
MRPLANVLVVDDDQPTVDFIAEALADEGYGVRALADASSALAAVEADPPDVIVLDLRMPGIDGVDVFRLLHDRGLATMPIILMTADNHAMQELITQGVKFILLKPFDLDTLLNCVAEALHAPEETQAQGARLLVPADPSNPPDDVHICT